MNRDYDKELKSILERIEYLRRVKRLSVIVFLVSLSSLVIILVKIFLEMK